MERAQLLNWRKNHRKSKRTLVILTYNWNLPEIKKPINKHWDIWIINRNFEEVFINLPVLYFSVTRRTFQPKLKKIKNIHLQKSSLHLKKWNFLAVMFKNSGNGNPEQKSLYFRKRKP